MMGQPTSDMYVMTLSYDNTYGVWRNRFGDTVAHSTVVNFLQNEFRNPQYAYSAVTWSFVSNVTMTASNTPTEPNWPIGASTGHVSSNGADFDLTNFTKTRLYYPRHGMAQGKYIFTFNWPDSGKPTTQILNSSTDENNLGIDGGRSGSLSSASWSPQLFIGAGIGSSAPTMIDGDQLIFPTGERSTVTIIGTTFLNVRLSSAYPNYIACRLSHHHITNTNTTQPPLLSSNNWSQLKKMSIDIPSLLGVDAYYSITIDNGTTYFIFQSQEWRPITRYYSGKYQYNSSLSSSPLWLDAAQNSHDSAMDAAIAMPINRMTQQQTENILPEQWDLLTG